MVFFSGGGASFCMMDIILNEMWAQDKVYILVSTWFCWNMKLASFYNLNFIKVFIDLEKYGIR
jgi:hypothetical protein